MTWFLKNSNGTFDMESSFGFIVQTPLGCGMPPHSVITTEFGLADGSLPQRIVIKEREFRLAGLIQSGGGEWEDLAELRQAFIDEISRDEVVVIDSSGVETITPVIVQYQSRNGSIVEIEALYVSGLEGGESQQGAENVAVQFLATDPFWKNPTADTAALNVNSTTTVSNQGTTITFPVMTIVGTGELLSLANQTNGLTITFFNLVALPGETLTLDLTPGQKTLTSDIRGGLNDRIAQGTRLTSWHLKKGDNTILLSAEADAELLTESGDILQTEASVDILASDTLNLTTAQFEFNRRHWGIEGVTA